MKKKQAPPPHVFEFRETLKDFFVSEEAVKRWGSRDSTRTMHLRASDYDRVEREATLDDVVEALRAAPWEVRDEFDRKLRQRLTETKPEKPKPANVPTPEDMRESCKGIIRWSDKELRDFSEHFRNTDQPIIGMVSGLCDEIMRMRRELRAVGVGDRIAGHLKDGTPVIRVIWKPEPEAAQ